MAKNSAANMKGSVTTAGSKKRKKKSLVKYLHVFYHYPEGWVIHTERYRDISSHDTRREAVEVARALAKQNEITLAIHHRNGRVEKWEHYNREPLPPKRRKVLYPTDPPRTATVEAIKRAVSEVINERQLANEPSASQR